MKNLIPSACALLLLAAGCGTDTGDLDRFIEDVATEQCDWEFRCCTDSDIEQLDGRKFTTAEQCRPYRKLALQKTWYLDRLAARQGRVRIDGKQAEACLSQMSEQLCNPKPGAPVMMTDPTKMDACATVFVGATEIGNECIYTHECVRGAHCANDGAALGRGVCVPYQKADEICNLDDDCDPQDKLLYCAKKDYHCHRRGQVGETCEIDATTGTLLLACDDTSGRVYCDASSSTCLRLPGEGQPCLVSPLPAGVTSVCDVDLTCDTSGGVGNGVCRALPSLGQECAQFGYQCKKPYYCNTSKAPAVCDDPAGLGDDCTQRACATDLYCDGQMCINRLPVGSACTNSNECLSGICGFSQGASTRSCQPAQTPGVAQCSGR